MRLAGRGRVADAGTHQAQHLHRPAIFDGNRASQRIAQLLGDREHLLAAIAIVAPVLVHKPAADQGTKNGLHLVVRYLFAVSA